MPGRTNSARALLRWQSVWRLRREGRSQRETAQVLGIAQGTVSFYLRKGEPPHGRAYPLMIIPKVTLFADPDPDRLGPDRTTKRTTKRSGRSDGRSRGAQVIPLRRRSGGDR
jgi:hypothetical protein